MSAITVAVNLVGNNNTGNAFVGMGTQLAQLETRANYLAKAFKGLSGTTKVAVGAAAVGAAAFMLFKAPLEVGLKGAMDLEAELLKLRQAAQANTDAIPVLTQSINDLGIKTVYSSAQAADAFTTLVKSGFGVSQVMYGMGAATNEYKQHAYDATEATHGLGFEALALGQLFGISATDGANLAATAIHQFSAQIAASKNPSQAATAIVNDLAGAYQNVATTGSDMLSFLKQTGPTASSMGIQFKDLAVTASVLGQHFGNLNTVGTRLRYFLQTLVHPTVVQQVELASLGLQSVNTGKSFDIFAAKLIKAGGATKDNIKQYGSSVTGLKEMFKAAQGVGLIPLDKNFSDWAVQTGFLNQKIYDSSGNLKSLKDIMDLLQGSLKGMSVAEKNAALANLFNVRGGDIGRMIASLKDFDVTYKRVNDRIGKTDAVEMAMQKLQTLQGAWEALKDSVTSALAVAFLNILPVITRFVNSLNTLTGVFLNLPPRVQTALGVFLIVGTVLAGLTVVLAVIVVAVTTLGGALVGLGLSAGGVIAVIGGVAAALVGIPALAAGGSVALGNSGLAGAMQRLSDLGAFLKTHLGELAGVITGVLMTALMLLKTNFTMTGNVIMGVIDVLGRIGGVFNALTGGFKGVWVALFQTGVDFAGLGSSIAAFFGGIGGWIASAVGWLSGLDAAWLSFFTSVGGWSGVLGALGGVFTDLGGSIASGAGALAAFLAPAAAVIGVVLLIAGAVAGVVMTFQHWWETSSKFRAIIIDLGSRFRDLGGLLLGQFSQAWQAIQTQMKNLQPVLGQMGGLWNDLKPVLMILGGIIIGVLVVAFGLLWVALKAVISALGPLFAGIIGVIGGVAQVVVGIVQVIIGIFKVLVGVVKGIFSGDWTTLGDGLHQLAQGVGNILGGLWNIIVSIFTGLIGTVWALVSNLVGGIIGFFKNLFDTLVGHSIVPDLIKSIISWFLSLPGQIISMLVTFVVNTVAKFTTMGILVLAAMVLMEQRVLATISQLVTNLLTWLNNMTGGGVQRVVSLKDQVIQHISAMAGGVGSNIASMVTNVLNKVGSMRDSIVSKAGSIKDGLLSPFQQAAGAIGNVVRAFANNMRNPLNGGIHGFQDLANDFADAIDWVASKIGAGSPLKHVYLPMIPAFASGVAGFAGGMALVGERGPEFAMMGGQQPALLGKRGPELRHLPPGTSILPNDQTIALLNGKLKFPAFGGGIGDVLGAIGGKLGDVLNWIGNSGSSIIGTALGAAGLHPGQGLPGVLGTLSSGGFNLLKTAAANFINKIKNTFLSAEAGVGGIGTAAGLLPGFPSINQLALRDVNRQNDCVPASVTAGASWLLHHLLDASSVKAAVYGAGYLGGESADRYMPYMARLGVKIGKQFGSQTSLVRDIESGIASGHPVLGTIPSNWNANSGGGTHCVVFAGYDRNRGLITAMNPWRGFWQTESPAWWAPRLRYGSVYPMGHMQNGGVIDEPSLGIGLVTGRRWTMGEREAEMVIPSSALGRAGGGRGGYHGPQTVVVQNVLNGKVIGESVLDTATATLRQVGSNRMGR